MRLIHKQLLMVGLLMGTIANQGYSQDQTLTLSLEQAIQIAIEDNPTIQIAGLEIERQDYVKKATSGNLLPQLSGSASYSRSLIKSTFTSGDMEFSFDPDNSMATALSLSIPLFTPAVYRTLKLNDEQMAEAVEKARASEVSLTSEVKKAYYNILVAEKSLLVLQQSEANIQQTVDQTRIMYENELASEYDLITAEVQLSNLQPTILQTKTSIETAKLLFKMYLSLPSSVKVELSSELEDLIKSSSTEMIFDTNTSNNTDLRSLDIQNNILDNQLKVLKTQRMPTLAAFSSFQFTGSNEINFDMTGSGATSNRFILQTPLSVGVQLSVPIFAGLTNVNNERQIKNSIKQLQLQRDYAEQSVNVQVESAINDIITAQEQMLANEKTVTQASKAYEISNTRYKAGAGTILELN